MRIDRRRASTPGDTARRPRDRTRSRISRAPHAHIRATHRAPTFLAQAQPFATRARKSRGGSEKSTPATSTAPPAVPSTKYVQQRRRRARLAQPAPASRACAVAVPCGGGEPSERLRGVCASASERNTFRSDFAPLRHPSQDSCGVCFSTGLFEQPARRFARKALAGWGVRHRPRNEPPWLGVNRSRRISRRMASRPPRTSSCYCLVSTLGPKSMQM